MAGVSFEPVEQLATTNTASAARELLIRREAMARAMSKVDEVLRSRRHGLTKEQFGAWHKAVRTGDLRIADPQAKQPYASAIECAAALVVAKDRFEEILNLELQNSRRNLRRAVTEILPAYLVFASESLRDLTSQLGPEIGLRNKKERARERHLLLYLQRVCTKNDTLSAFGPTSWGKVSPDVPRITLMPRPGIAERECFLERWTAHGAAAAINADSEAKLEIPPRIHPAGRIVNGRFTFADTGESVDLESEMSAIVRRCDGTKPAYSLGVEPTVLEQLVELNLVRWQMEVPALDPYAFDSLIKSVLQWRHGTARQRWLDRLQPIAQLAIEFKQKTETNLRAGIMHEAQSRLDQLGTHHTASGRFLYAATNPIGEECVRESHFVISEDLINEVAIEAEPWLDLWRDSYAFIASRVAQGLRPIFDSAKRDTIPLPAFLRLCEAARLSLTGSGLVALAHLAFQEVKAAFRAMMASHVDDREYELTRDDCHFVRHTFSYEKFDEYTYPSADLQLAAESVEAVQRGEYQWILAELHPPVALLHHGFYWSCPDHTILSDALRRTVFGKPNFYFGFFAADFTATTTVRIFDALPDLTYFVAPQRPNPEWLRIAPAEAEVYVDAASGDICLRKIDGHQSLGSFTRAWLIPLGFHPFQFGIAPHTPRLRCGKIVVQRRAWTVTLDELGKGDFTGVSRDLILAVERLRASRDLPRFVYIRPTEQALRRSGAEGRDKDTKPVFVDLESYLFIELFHRWLCKAIELEVTEMLPAPDQLLWREEDGRRTFELRTQIIPAK